MSDEEAPPEIEDLAQACVRSVERALLVKLDFTPDTLPILDHYLIEARGENRDQILDLVVPMAGAYFGEVVRRSLGPCRWTIPDHTDYASYRLEFEQVFLSFNPLGAAREALLQAEAEGFGAHFLVLPEQQRAVADALELGPAVREEDFYRLAIRLETVEQVASLLTELATADEAPRRFGPEVYAALRDRPRSSTVH